MSKHILFIHQSSDFYGSDKTLFQLVTKLDKKKYIPIVILPVDGILKQKLESEKIIVYLLPVMKVHSQMSFFDVKGLTKNLKSIKELRKLDNKYNFNLIYSNTLATFLGGVYSKLYKKPHIWHVHEIVENKKINRVYSYLTNALSDLIIFNSKASQDKLVKNNNNILKKSIVIHNGVELNLHPKLKDSTETISIGLIGRINNWKGHDLLLEAFGKLKQDINQKTELNFVGSTTITGAYIKDDLETKISNLNLVDSVFINDFTNNIDEQYKSMDIIVVPSVRPEPFGMVTIEAMNNMRPVVASAHGGTLDIIEDNVNGVLFIPNDVDSLVEKLKILILDDSFRNSIAINGYNNVKENFTVENYVGKIEYQIDKYENSYSRD